jgi:hypothetical protein
VSFPCSRIHGVAVRFLTQTSRAVVQGQPWFYLRLFAYRFFWLSEGHRVFLDRPAGRDRTSLTRLWILMLSSGLPPAGRDLLSDSEYSEYPIPRQTARVTFARPYFMPYLRPLQRLRQQFEDLAIELDVCKNPDQRKNCSNE